LQEIKPSTRDADLRRALSQVTERKNTGLSRQEHTYTPHASLSHAKKGRNFGVVTFVRDDVEVVGVREVDWDKEGRVVVVELEGLAVYNVYALNGSEYSWARPNPSIQPVSTWA
jgi:exonuclease III